MHILVVSTNSIMDTIIQPVKATSNRGTYRHHTVEFKRVVVEESLVPGASVSRIARAHNVNANQVFAWRKLHSEGRLGDTATACPQLLPIALAEPQSSSQASDEVGPVPSSGSIELIVGKAKLRVEGCVDTAALALMLDRLLR
jgi:transposase